MLGKIEELKLISRCVLADDRRAFGILVEAYQPSIRRFFLNLTAGNEALSDDFAQETFIKAYTNLRSFKGIARFSTWLYRIAYNEFYSWQRVSHDVTTDEPVQPIEEPTDDVAAADAKIDVWKAMRSLSEAERTAVTLFYIDDQPMKRIMEITGMAENTIKSHLLRGKAKMAKVINYGSEFAS
ncbi:MAG: RNA polymerase sigma factor [Muribaculaceae bacterium]|jgi:RNA polymerase sigma-70 factor, ECF subfamily|nr:RNA polymerase sigma factor [Muribaculaceae bacterium]